MKDGFIIIDKPQGYTSFDVVAVMKRLLSEKKIGHTGTLDPMATGVLVILCGKATKAASFIPDSNKKYVAGVSFGIETDTQDITGKILKTENCEFTREQLSKTLLSFEGEIFQTPPMYSALSVGGVRLYDMARKGVTVDREARKINIFSIKLLNFSEEKKTAEIEVSCSKGTYIRTLCADIGKALGTCAVMSSLRRTEACSFTVDEAIPLEKARRLSENKALELSPVDRLFESFRKVYISPAQSNRFKNGGELFLDRAFGNANYKDGEIFSVYDSEKIFLGLGKVCTDKNELSVLKLF